MDAYVCYENNSASLINECDEKSDIDLFYTIEEAINWLKNRVENGEAKGFLVDEEYKHTLAKQNIEQEISDNNRFSITMFYETQKNWYMYYDIIIEKKSKPLPAAFLSNYEIKLALRKRGHWILTKRTKLVPTDKIGLKENFTICKNGTLVDENNINKKAMILKKRISIVNYYDL